MPAPESTRGAPAVNPTTPLRARPARLAEAGIAVETRPDIGAIELVIRDHGRVAEILVLAPVQALAVAQRLVSAVQAMTAAEGRS